MVVELVKPRKPPTAYWLWFGKHRQSLADEAGSNMGRVVAKLAGAKWKTLSATKKKPFEDIARKKKAAYDAAMDEFVAAGGVRSTRAPVNRTDPRGKPAKPPTSYWLWLRENREALKKEAGSGAGPIISRLAGKKWKALPEAQKNTFTQQAAAKKAMYVKAMCEWKNSDSCIEDVIHKNTECEASV